MPETTQSPAVEIGHAEGQRPQRDIFGVRRPPQANLDRPPFDMEMAARDVARLVGIPNVVGSLAPGSNLSDRAGRMRAMAETQELIRNDMMRQIQRREQYDRRLDQLAATNPSRTPADLVTEAGNLARHLRSLGDAERSQELARIQRENPTLHALVRSAMIGMAALDFQPERGANEPITTIDQRRRDFMGDGSLGLPVGSGGSQSAFRRVDETTDDALWRYCCVKGIQKRITPDVVSRYREAAKSVMSLDIVQAIAVLEKVLESIPEEGKIPEASECHCFDDGKEGPCVCHISGKKRVITAA